MRTFKSQQSVIASDQRERGNPALESGLLRRKAPRNDDQLIHILKKLAIFIFLFAFNLHAHRIVSLAPSITEILFELELNLEIVGVTRYCDKPEAAQKLPKVGGFLDPSLEAILALKPTLVIGVPSPQTTGIRKILQSRGIKTLLLPLESLGDLQKAIHSIGIQTNKKTRANQLIKNLHNQLASFKPTPHPKKALVVLSTFPLIVAGPNTYPAQALSQLGYLSPLPKQTSNWSTLSIESLIASKPDYLIVTGCSTQKEELERFLHPFRTNPSLKNLRVIGAKKPIFTRPSLSIIEDLQRIQLLLL